MSLLEHAERRLGSSYRHRSDRQRSVFTPARVVCHRQIANWGGSRVTAQQYNVQGEAPASARGIYTFLVSNTSFGNFR